MKEKKAIVISPITPLKPRPRPTKLVRSKSRDAISDDADVLLYWLLMGAALLFAAPIGVYGGFYLTIPWYEWDRFWDEAPHWLTLIEGLLWIPTIMSFMFLLGARSISQDIRMRRYCS